MKTKHNFRPFQRQRAGTLDVVNASDCLCDNCLYVDECDAFKRSGDNDEQTEPCELYEKFNREFL